MKHNLVLNLENINCYVHALLVIVCTIFFIVIYSLKYELSIFIPISILFLFTCSMLITKLIVSKGTYQLRIIQKKAVTSIYVILFFIIYINLWHHYRIDLYWSYNMIMVAEIGISSIFCIIASLSMYMRNRENTYNQEMLYLLVLFLPNPSVFNLSLLNIIGRICSFYITYYLNLYGGIILDVETNVSSLITTSMWLLFVNDYVILCVFFYWFLFIYSIYSHNTFCELNMADKDFPEDKPENNLLAELPSNKVEEQSIKMINDEKSKQDEKVIKIKKNTETEINEESDVKRLMLLSRSIRVLGK